MMASKPSPPDYDHWSSDWEDVIELQTGFEVVMAVRHWETDAFVAVVPVAAEERGALDASTTLGREYRREVRPRQGAPVVSEHTTTYAGACKADAIERTEQWLTSHSDGLPDEVGD
jgi:hypothetical protein